MIKITQIDENFSVYKNNKVVIWGTGVYGKKMLEYFRHFKLSVDAFCDNNRQKWNTEVMEIPVISPEQLKELCEKETNVLVQVGFNTCEDNSIYVQLNGMGIRYITLDEGLWAVKTHRAIGFFENMRHLSEFSNENDFLDAIRTIHMREFHQKINFHTETLLIVCLPPKTADHTINATFHKNAVPYNNMWHQVKAVNMDLLSTLYNPVKIITAVREPIGQNLSLTFELITTSCHTELLFRFISQTDEPDTIMEMLKSLIFKNGGDVQDLFDKYLKVTGYMEKTYDKEPESIKKMHIIQHFIPKFQKHVMDIMAYPFDKEKGYTIMKEGNVEVFVYQLEKLNDIVPQLSEWVGVSFSKLENDYIGESKWTGVAYKQAQKEITFSQEYFDACFDEPYVNHFYSEKDIEKFKNRWRSHIK